jgi:hypothetical protein
MINKFDEFEKMNESSLMGNPGLPGEPNEDGGKGDYLAGLDARIQQKLRDLQRRYGMDVMKLIEFSSKAHQIQRGHELELEKIAEEAIVAEYEEILHGIRLDIKFDMGREIPKMMKDVPGCCEEQLKEIEDLNIISEIHRRKISKNIMQGEAVNTKKILNSEVSRDGLRRVLGRQEADTYIDLLNKMTDIAHHFFWIIPFDVQLAMWENDKSGMEGSCKVEWTTPEDEEENEKRAQDILDELTNDPELDMEDVAELFDDIDAVIHALGKDYAMLIHETIKGIYQLIISNAIPHDEEIAQKVIENTDTLRDEIEDLKYGPEIAADLRDYIEAFPESDKISNLRARVYGKMMLMPANEMLELILKILENNPAAKGEVQKIINEIKEELDNYNSGNYEDMEDARDLPTNPSSPLTSGHYDDETDYANMSKADLQKLVDQALDAGDIKKFKELSKHLSEGMKFKAYKKYPKLDECRLSNLKHGDDTEI